MDNFLTASTHDQDVFSFFPNERFCNGFEEVLSRYREIVPQLKLAGLNSTTTNSTALDSVIDPIHLDSFAFCYRTNIIRPGH